MSRAKRRLLLTCFGGNIFYETFLDFQSRGDIELFVSDVNPQAKARYLTDNFITVKAAEHPDFGRDLLEQAKALGIDMIVPCGDEEAFALMRDQALFQKEDITVAVQDESLLPVFTAKSAQYAYLAEKGFPVPEYETVTGPGELDAACERLGYPARPLLVKPDMARGGRGIILLNETRLANKDNLVWMNRDLFRQCLDTETVYLLMPYIDGVVYDVDVLSFGDGECFFGQRKRLNNVTKLFCGNVFDNNPALDAYVRRLYACLPTKYLLDYDVMVDAQGGMHLLEINPRPSGSTVSYLPYGVNLFYILAKACLDGERLPLDVPFAGQEVVTFYKMVKGVHA